MKIISILILGFSVGCASHRGRVEMVSVRYKPKKEGLIQMSNKSEPSKEKARILMKKFCGDERPELVGVDKVSTAVGSTTAPLGGGMNYTTTNFSSANLVRFTCEPADSRPEVSFSDF